MDATKPKKKNLTRQNLLENLRDISGGYNSSQNKNILSTPLEQILGKRLGKKFSGELHPGESVEVKDIYSGKQEANEKLKNQIAFERKLAQEEREQFNKKSFELRVQLKTLMDEVSKLAQTTVNLSEDVKIAAMQAPIEPGQYHLIFFEKLLEFIKSFRQKIEDADIWLAAVNSRTQKKNYWSNYKKHGGKFLLSSEHYLTRSAG